LGPGRHRRRPSLLLPSEKAGPQPPLSNILTPGGPWRPRRCGLHACRLLAMKSFPDADRRFGRCCPCSELQIEMKQPRRVTQQRRKTERQIASASVSSSCPLNPSGTGAGDSAMARGAVQPAPVASEQDHLAIA
jgi:hypothetical protein